MKLTDKQFLAASHKNGPCLVLAVPGAGKTTMLLERIKMLQSHCKSQKILTLTFSKTQAADMKNRYSGPETNFMTIHAFCYLIIRNFYKKQRKELKILENDDSYNKYNLIKKLYYQVNGSVISSEDLKNFFTQVGYMRNALLDRSYLDKSNIKNIQRIYDLYEAFKKEKGYIDFDDMQSLALDLLKENPSLLRSVKNHYPYIQVDEGQDTSLLQFKILEKIAYPENNIIIVADDDQSIYSFRAAQPDYLLNIRQTYPDATIITMEENHRSQANIVSVADKFIKNNTKRYEKNIHSQKPKGSKIHTKILRNSKATYKYIMKNIDPTKTNAILYRNNISSLNLISFLMNDGVDFAVNNGSKDFFASKLISDIFDIINFSENFYDVDLFRRIYYKLGIYLTQEELASLDLSPINYTVFDYLKESLDDKRIRLIKAKERDLLRLRKMSLGEKIAHIYHKMGYGSYIKDHSNKYYEVILNKDLYIESMVNFTKNLQNLDEFRKKIEDFEQIVHRRTTANIILSTIHRSKGLEYDQVFVIDLVKNEFPSTMEVEDRQARLAEERRIFYVAMTRARDDLHLLSLKSRNGQKVSPSPFYEEILKYI